MTESSKTRLLPQPTPETAHFWDGTRKGELRLQSCGDCLGTYFPPRPFCPKCGSRNVKVVQATGHATLLSYVVSSRPAPGIEAPYVLAIVRLEEGPQMMTNIVNCEGKERSLKIDVPLRVVFEAQSEEITLPMFELVEAA